MEPTTEQLKQEIDVLRKELAGYTTEMKSFRSVHVSRRGVEGGRGEKGEVGATGAPGQSITGATGRPGKDADVTEVVAAAQAAMSRELTAFQGALSGVIVEELKTAGFLDADGKAILLQPRDGVDGKNSEVPGPRGVPGASVVGPNGKDATVKIGRVDCGDVASVTVRETLNGPVLDFVLPRGERGSDGAASTVAGPEGKPGRDSDVSEEMDAFRTEINKQVSAISTQLEARTRHIAKGDIAAAIRGHLAESHSNDGSK
jgi:hypothetical protein